MSDDPEYGPAMAALTVKQRGFVMAMITTPGCTQAAAARAAGYSDASEAAKVTGHYLAHHPGVQAAIREEAGKRLNSASLMAAGVLIDILGDEETPTKERLKAAAMLLDRTGFAAAQNINVNKTVTDRTGTAIMERIKALAQKHGLDARQLLGGPSPVVDGEFSEVGDG